jgi:hypothetical protein
MAVAYGLGVEPDDDPCIKMMEGGLELAEDAMAHGTYLIDIVPTLKYVPEWFPGASFQRKAKLARSFLLDMLELPFSAAKRHAVR